ncbi:MAG TPA: ribosomal protein S18-alanine N-acetyltransferase [bacterium]|nr:ribosomal protein S18-alanine N-acetyltransferase [bacterium]
MPQLQTDPDPALLAAVDAQCFAEAWDTIGYAQLRANPAVQAWLLRDDAGAPAGLLCFQRVGDEAEVYRIAVLPALRGQGLGRWLLVRFMARARAEGLRRAYLEVRESNAAARRLYEAAGFAEAGRRPGYYRQPSEDAVLYAWDAAPDAPVRD